MVLKTASFFFIASIAFNAFSAVAPNTLSPAEQKAGWVLLFDGVDKSANWREGFTGNTNTWIIDSGALANTATSGGTELFTKQTYSNFEFTAEWKLNIKGNSGIFYRVDSRSRPCSSQEWGILDDVNGDDRTALGHMPGETAMPIKTTAADYDLYPTVQNGVTGSAYVSIAKPYNQWNQGVLWANDSLIEHWLNGQKVVDFKIATPDWLQRFQFSKYSNQSCPAAMNYQQTWGRWPSGPIGLQDHGGGLRVWFRNIKVRPMTPGGKLVSPLVTPNGGSFTGAVKVVLEAAITGSVIRYTLDGSDPASTSPAYTDTLTLTSGATLTLKAKTFRDRFQTSDVTTAAFTFGGTPVLKNDARIPDVAFSVTGSRLSIHNRNGVPVAVDILAVNGQNRAAFRLNGGIHEYNLGHLHGLYLLRTRAANGYSRVDKIALP